MTSIFTNLNPLISKTNKNQALPKNVPPNPRTRADQKSRKKSKNDTATPESWDRIRLMGLIIGFWSDRRHKIKLVVGRNMLGGKTLNMGQGQRPLPIW